MAPAHVHSPSSVGILVQALVTKRPSSAKHVPRSKTSVRHVCWISSMVCRPKCVTLRWPSRARRRRATSTASTMRKTWKTRYVYLPCHGSEYRFNMSVSRWQMVPRRRRKWVAGQTLQARRCSRNWLARIRTTSGTAHTYAHSLSRANVNEGQIVHIGACCVLCAKIFSD